MGGRDWRGHTNAEQTYFTLNATEDKQEFLYHLGDFFKDPEDVSLLAACCKAADNCCSKIQKLNVASTSLLSSTSLDLVGKATCPATWDGWQCWDPGHPGKNSSKSCPEYIYFLTHGGHRGVGCDNMAVKQCLDNGNWFSVHEGNPFFEWTDYSPCDKTDDTINLEHVRLALYAISTVALVPAIVIFHIYRSLQVTRISIHKNLFISLLLFTATTVLYRVQVLLPHIASSRSTYSSVSPILENSVWCRMLMALTKYFRLTNYSWMWSEGYYLHRLLTHTFEEQHVLPSLLILGWLVPFIPALSYSLLRLHAGDGQCWAQPSAAWWVEWLTYLPGLLCIAGNIFFFLNIFRILLTKLRAPHANEPTNFRTAVQACSVLVPLFGLQWLVTFYRLNSGGCYLLAAYKYTDVLLDSLQGFIVSVTFCYRNGEIITLLKRSHSSWRSNRLLEMAARREGSWRGAVGRKCVQCLPGQDKGLVHSLHSVSEEPVLEEQQSPQ